jgi:hypothetical protein
MQYWIQISKNKIFRTFICSTFIWSTHLSAGPIFQRFWFLSWFHWKRVAVNKKVTVPSVPSDYYFERFKVATMNWLIVTDYMCPKRPRICSVYRNHNAVLSAFMTCHRVHLRFWWVHVARSLVFCVVIAVNQFNFTRRNHWSNSFIVSSISLSRKSLKGTTSSGISYHLRDIYSICRCCWNVATYKWKVHNGKIEIISFYHRHR